MFQDTVPNDQMNFSVSYVRPGAGKTVVIVCPSQNDLERAKAELNKHQDELGAAVDTASERKPRVSIRGVPKEVSAAEFLEELRAKNQLTAHVKVVKKLENHREFVKTAAFVVKVDKITRDAFLKPGKISIKWVSKGCKFGHLAQTCRRKDCM